MVWKEEVCEDGVCTRGFQDGSFFLINIQMEFCS